MNLLDWADSHARAVDPLTSKQAAREIEPHLNDLHQQFLSKLLEMGQATSNEVAAAITTNISRHNTLRRRASDLVAFGLIRELGSRICSTSGRKATLYEVIVKEE